MRPNSYGSSTIGMKKSVVATSACVSFRRYTAASSHDSVPTRRFGNALVAGALARISLSNAGVSLQPQPPPCASCVSLTAAVSIGWFIVNSGEKVDCAMPRQQKEEKDSVQRERAPVAVTVAQVAEFDEVIDVRSEGE